MSRGKSAALSVMVLLTLLLLLVMYCFVRRAMSCGDLVSLMYVVYLYESPYLLLISKTLRPSSRITPGIVIVVLNVQSLLKPSPLIGSEQVTEVARAYVSNLVGTERLHGVLSDPVSICGRQ